MKSTPPNQVAPASATGYDTEFLRRHSSKVLIQDAATRRYLTATGLWTTQPELAMTFRSGSSALEHVNRLKLNNVNLVLSRAITVSEVIPMKELLPH
jgi:hypothetical protein